MYLQDCVIVSEINFIIVLFYCKNFIEVLMDFFGRSLSSGVYKRKIFKKV